MNRLAALVLSLPVLLVACAEREKSEPPPAAQSASVAPASVPQLTNLNKLKGLHVKKPMVEAPVVGGASAAVPSASGAPSGSAK
jgi:hypothetical protein